MIDRPTGKAALAELMQAFPVTGILGPRQSGKTTLAQEITHGQVFDLENPRDAAMLAQPQLALEGLSGLIVLDDYPLADGISALPITGVSEQWGYP